MFHYKKRKEKGTSYLLPAMHIREGIGIINNFDPEIDADSGIAGPAGSWSEYWMIPSVRDSSLSLRLGECRSTVGKVGEVGSSEEARS